MRYAQDTAVPKSSRRSTSTNAGDLDLSRSKIATIAKET